MLIFKTKKLEKRNKAGSSCKTYKYEISHSLGAGLKTASGIYSRWSSKSLFKNKALSMDNLFVSTEGRQTIMRKRAGSRRELLIL